MQMIRVAIVEDEKQHRTQILRCLERYGSEHNLLVETEVFASGASFLFNYHPNFDVVLLDIEMPVTNGMEAARAIRKKDDDVMIVFITGMANYAAQGYEVGAYDFILKPFTYEKFCFSFDRIQRRLELNQKNCAIVVGNSDEQRRIRIADLRYVEVYGHTLSYHTHTETICVSGTIRSTMASLAQYGFYQCSKSVLINLRYVTQIDLETLYLEDTAIRFSRGTRKDLVRALTEFFGNKQL